MNKYNFSISKQSFSLSKKVLILLWAIFVITYLINILQFPIFEDEAEYLLLAQQIVSNPIDNFFIYFYSGLLPMFGWLIAITTYFVGDTLLAGRLLNVLIASTLLFWVELVSNLYSFNKRFRYVAMISILSSTILLLNTRVALLDTSILVFTCWYIYFTAKLLKKPKSKLEYLGLFISLLFAFLTKATAVFGVPSIAFLLFTYFRNKNIKTSKYLKPVLVIYTVVFTIVIIVAIFFGKFILADDQTSFIGLIGIDAFLDRIRLNIRLTWIWSLVYFGQFLIAVPFLFKLRKYKSNEFFIAMVLLLLTSATLMITMNKFYYPRHILNLTVPLIMLLAAVLSEMTIFWGAIILSATILMRIVTNYFIVFNYQEATIALEDRVVYFEEYTAGTRVDDVSKKINTLSEENPITVWLDGSWTLEYGLRRNLAGNKNIKFLSYRLGKYLVPHDVSKIYKDEGRVTYVVVNRFQPPNKMNLELIESFEISFRQGIQIYKLE